MHSGPEPFDSPDAVALCTAQQAEMLELYAGEADIGPTRDGPMFVPPRGIFELFRTINASGTAVVFATHDLDLVRENPGLRVVGQRGSRHAVGLGQ